MIFLCFSFDLVVDDNKDGDIWRKSRPKGEENANKDSRDNNRDNRETPETEKEKGVWRTADKKPVAAIPEERKAQNKVIEGDGWRTERQKVLMASKEAANANPEVSKPVPTGKNLDLFEISRFFAIFEFSFNF